MPMSDDSIGHPVFGHVTAVPLPITDGRCLFCRFVGSCNLKKASGGSLSIRKKKGARPFQHRSALGRGGRLPLATEKTLENGNVFGISGAFCCPLRLAFMSVGNALERSRTAVLQGRCPISWTTDAGPSFSAALTRSIFAWRPAFRHIADLTAPAWAVPVWGAE